MTESQKSNDVCTDHDERDIVNEKQVEDLTALSEQLKISSDDKEEQQQQQHQQHDPVILQQQQVMQPNHHEIDVSLLEPFYYINSVPGKNIRSLLIDCFQIWFQVNDIQKLELIKDIIGNLHNASLLIDDIEDNSTLRRGIPVAHAIFGIPTVLNCANYVYFIALNKCQQLQNTTATTIFVTELLNLHRGQGYDINWREMSQCPSEEQYIHMVLDKTGGLFRLAVGLLQLFATHHTTTNFTSLVNNLGLYFQIRDDYINLVDDDYFRSKTFCEDISEGKFSYPIIHCINNSNTTIITTANNDSATATATKDYTNSSSSSNSSSAGIQLLSILKQRTDDSNVKCYAQRILYECGSLEYTRTKCNELKDDIINSIEEFGNNPILIDIINKLHIPLLEKKEIKQL